MTEPQVPLAVQAWIGRVLAVKFTNQELAELQLSDVCRVFQELRAAIDRIKEGYADD